MLYNKSPAVVRTLGADFSRGFKGKNFLGNDKEKRFRIFTEAFLPVMDSPLVEVTGLEAY